MNTIGFKNFRRFANFPEMDINGVTCLVGPNNSGKSTVVKAMMLCLDNLRLLKSHSTNNLFEVKPKFYFDANQWHDVKIKTFSRAIHNKTVLVKDLEGEHQEMPSIIEFYFSYGDFRFVIHIHGDAKENSASGDILFISIEDKVNLVKYAVDYQAATMTYTVAGESSDEMKLTKRLFKTYKEVQGKVDQLAHDMADNSEFTDEFFRQNETLESLKGQIEEILGLEEVDREDFDYEEALRSHFKRNIRENNKAFYEFILEDYVDKVDTNLFVQIIENFIRAAQNPGIAEPKDDDNPNIYGMNVQAWELDQANRKFLRSEIDKLRASRDALSSLVNNVKLEYISAHAANQDTLYNTADKNDYVAQTIHEFCRNKISSGQAEDIFVKEWMKKFDIGSSYEIEDIDGEAYRVKIVDEDGSKVNLADKGMGSIQLMVLLFKLASILRKYKLATSKSYDKIPVTIVIEEPEQNLHPCLQSQLASLFDDFYSYGCDIIIETHSEYMIRKFQVIVKEAGFEEAEVVNEFAPNIYYFNQTAQSDPFIKMQFRPDGCFANDFGEGFFDEAENLAFKIL